MFFGIATERLLPPSRLREGLGVGPQYFDDLLPSDVECPPLTPPASGRGIASRHA
jgi:hypothetical protein